MTMELKQIVEALLFTAERPLTSKEIREILSKAVDEENPEVTEAFRGLREASVEAVLQELKVDLDTHLRGFHLQEIGGGKILSPERQKTIERRLRHVINQLDAAGK
jgi:chromosome segregation and condensation protein ScpB